MSLRALAEGVREAIDPRKGKFNSMENFGLFLKWWKRNTYAVHCCLRQLGLSTSGDVWNKADHVYKPAKLLVRGLRGRLQDMGVIVHPELAVGQKGMSGRFLLPWV